jgi:AcrR family transcriptional regulator
MRQIARDAHVTMATIHHYYGGKQALFEACVDAMYTEMDALRGEIEAVLARWTGSRDALGEFIDEAIRRAYAFSRRHRPGVQLMMRTVIDTGELEAAKRERYLLPNLERGAELLAPLLGVTPERVRVAMLSINYLIARFALSTPRELALVTGNPDADADEAVRIVEDYLVSIARDQLHPRGDA